MIGRTYVNAPVSSNMITTRDTVMRVAPARAEAAPITAYVPGVTHGISGSQLSKAKKVGCSRCHTSMATSALLRGSRPVSKRGCPCNDSGERRRNQARSLHSQPARAKDACAQAKGASDTTNTEACALPSSPVRVNRERLSQRSSAPQFRGGWTSAAERK